MRLCCHLGVRSQDLGKEKFKVDASEDRSKIHVFELQDLQAGIYVHNKVQTLLEAVNGRHGQEPTCNIAYHDMQADDGNEPGAFSLIFKHRVFFVPSAVADGPNEDDKINQMSVAGGFPVDRWSSELVSVLWATKWAVNGLTPVRPLVILNSEVSLGADRAVRLSRD